MSIQTEITRIKTNIENAYKELEKKGAILPQVQNSANLEETIANVPSGGVSLNDIEMYVADFTNPLKITVVNGAINGVAVCYIRD